MWMNIYFYGMAKKVLTKESEFVVGEEKILNYIMAFLFLALFAAGFLPTLNNSFIANSVLDYLLMMALLPSVMFFNKARSRRVYIRINKTGIYVDEMLVTGWDKFLKAYIKEKPVTLSWRDNFILVIEFKRNDPTKGFRRFIKLTNTQNKSEEDIIAAIRFFLTLHKSALV
jgi:hypothetical protein